MTDTYPRQSARTRRFTLGAPRDLRVARDGSRVAFTRSTGGSDPVNRLWVLDVAAGTERLVADPVALLSGISQDDLPEAERARRERAREAGEGIVAFDTDPDLTRAAFALAGRLFVADLAGGADGGAGVREWASSGEVFDPRWDPDARRVAYVSGRTLRLSDGSSDTLVVGDDDPLVSWGSAEFVAAEEMHRSRGFWWAPDGSALAVARVDVSPVRTWWISSPVTPWVQPRAVRYPAAGTPNARVGLAIVTPDGAGRVDVDWDGDGALEYLADVVWSAGHAPLVVGQTRDQRTLVVLDVDAATGGVRERERVDDDCWVELVPGAPAWMGERLLTVIDRQDTRRLCADGEPLTPVGLHVRRVVHVENDHAVVAASDEPTELHLYRVGSDGSCVRLTSEPGVHSGAFGGGTSVLVTATLDRPNSTVVVRSETQGAAAPPRPIASYAETPLVVPQPRLLRIGERELRCAVLLPTDADPNAKLPVLLDPYGGPHALRVQASSNAFCTSQWFADEGFAVVVCDGRGTPGRGASWERAVRGDLATHALDDQVAALEGVGEHFPQLDLSRVAIRGWSFGGYLAALAVLRRPDLFHAAVAGAPVTDWRLYDTHYTERYLGHPDDEPGNYARTDLCAMAAELERPLLLVHGMADDNVVVAHTLALSRALLEAGRPHRVLPLSGVTHMTPQEVVAENLLRVELAFLREALRIEGNARYQWRPMLPRRQGL